MAANVSSQPGISAALIDAIRSFPATRLADHCGAEFSVSPFEIYANCPQCGTRIKLRAFSAQPEVADVFDAVFEWLEQPEADARYRQRASQLREVEN